VLMGYEENDPEAKSFLAAFRQRLTELGWVDGSNLRTDVRWAPGTVDRMRTLAKELVELQPDAILANSTPITAALQRETRTIPIVFAVASDPVGSGFVASLNRPGGNITGFSIAEPTLPGKWMQLLMEITPRLKRTAMMFNPDTAPYVSSYYLPYIRSRRPVAQGDADHRPRSQRGRDRNGRDIAGSRAGRRPPRHAG
jgi:putative ABC transport system substrate-binding protein